MTFIFQLIFQFADDNKNMLVYDQVNQREIKRVQLDCYEITAISSTSQDEYIYIFMAVYLQSNTETLLIRHVYLRLIMVRENIFFVPGTFYNQFLI